MNRFSSQKSPRKKIASENISNLDDAQANIFESRVALLSELSSISVKELADDLSISDKIRIAYEGSAPDAVSDEDLKEKCEKDSLKAFFNSISIVEKLEICRKLACEFDLCDHQFISRFDADDSLSSEPLPPSAKGRIAYMKNNYTESAFLKFSKTVSNSRSAYQQSFDDVCEEVYSGSCEFCILPIESSTEGRLNSFYSMIDRYELKISAVCLIEQHDSQRFTKFALLKKSIFGSDLNRGSSSQQILEFKLYSAISENNSQSDSASPVCDILFAAKACGMKQLRIDSMPLPYNNDMMAYYISLAVNDSSFIQFLMYITLEFPQCDPIGVYFTVN